jgi:hypothetical protein
MKTVAEGRRWPVAAWIIGAISSPLLVAFAVLSHVKGGFGRNWFEVIAGPVALVVITYVGAALVISLVCRLVRGEGDPVKHLSAWALTYPATITAFAIIILGHLIFPAGSFPGFPQFLWFAALLAVLLWKVLLYFIYLRAVGGLGFKQMIVASAILFAITLTYEWVIVTLGIGQVPFI